MSHDAPFAGLRVLDLSQGIAGPYCGQLLGRHGADVIKVEPPEGDWARTLGRRYGDQSAFSLAANVGKRSIALDLKRPDGRALVRRLAARADVFLEGFRPGVAARLGVGYEDIAALAPGVVYLSVSGFGQTGPDADRPAVDTIAQAFTGLMHATRAADGTPMRAAAVIMDLATALSAFQAVAVALYARRDSGRGRHIGASLIQGGATIQAVQLISHFLEDGKPQPGLTPSGTFPTADGWLNLSILHDGQFRGLCAALEIPDAADDPRFATNDLRFQHAAELTARLGAALRRRTSAEWAARLRAARIMHQPVQSHREYLAHPQVEAAGLVTWIEQPGVGRVPILNPPGVPPLPPGATAPSLDQHRKEILAELGESH